MFRGSNPALLLLLLVGTSGDVAAQTALETRTYVNPTVRGMRLDWCRHFARDCGKAAADLFCKEQKFDEALRFERDDDVGKRGQQTLVFGDGRTCAGPTCAGFRVITCGRNLAAAPAPARPVMAPAAKPLRDLALSESGARVLQKAPPPKRLGTVQPVGPLPAPMPAGARLFYCSGGACDFQLTHDIDVDPKAPSIRQWFYWDVAKITAAGAVRWQVSDKPFAMGGRGALDGTGLLASGEGTGKTGGFEIDLKKIAAASTSDPERLYVRVVPLAAPGAEAPVGQSSNVIRVLYGARATAQSPLIDVKVTGFRLELVQFEYRPYQIIQRWPPGCKDIPRDEGRRGLDAVVYGVEKAWDFVSESYEWIKQRAVDLAEILTAGLIPREYLQTALDGALVAAGIPPDVPNFGDLVRNGVDGLAKEVARGVVAQMPAGQLAPTLGNLAADVAVSEAEKMATDELKRRVEREIAKRSRDVLLKVAAEFEEQAAKAGPDMYCRSKYVPPTYLAVIRNVDTKPAEDAKIVFSDSASLFQPMSLWIDIAPGKTANLSLAPNPLVRVVQRSQMPDRDRRVNEQHWWREFYEKRATRISVAGMSQRQCPAGAAGAACQESMRTLYVTPSIFLTKRFDFSKP